MKAFIPISVSTALYSSERMAEGLARIPDIYSGYVFVIGDILQEYNDASDSRRSMEAVFERWKSRPTKIFSERSAWIRKRMKETGRNGSKLAVLSMDDVVDMDYFHTLRNIYVLYCTDIEFRSDVNQLIAEATQRRRNHRSIEIARRLSLMYILEEITLNLIVRKKYDVHDEYYLGAPMVILVEMFKGKFVWFLDKIGYSKQYELGKARFFFWAARGNEAGWEEYLVVRKADKLINPS